MLKKFTEGLMFGAGFAISYFIIYYATWAISMSVAIPSALESIASRTKEPKFEHPAEAKIAESKPGKSARTEDFSFFKHSKMEIPQGGGILAMSPMNTAGGSKRPSTYQLWLTESKLWQIRTVEEKVEIEELPYPKNASTDDLDNLMRKNLGLGARQSTMTVSIEEIAQLKSSGNSWRNEINGKLRITDEGVVFILPNPYGT